MHASGLRPFCRLRARVLSHGSDALTGRSAEWDQAFSRTC